MVETAGVPPYVVFSPPWSRAVRRCLPSLETMPRPICMCGLMAAESFQEVSKSCPSSFFLLLDNPGAFKASGT